MKSSSEKNLKKTTRSLYRFTGGETFSGETTNTGTTSGGTDTTNTLITTLTTTQIFRSAVNQR